jgi:hypothetical protein
MYAYQLLSLCILMVLAKFRPAFLEKRRRGLEFFLSTVLLMPEVGASPIVKKVRSCFKSGNDDFGSGGSCDIICDSMGRLVN